MRRRQLAIVGAGVSGLSACKYALSKGYEPVVFESQGSLGGVWTKTFEITRLQTGRDSYRFTDFPWPSSVMDMFPGAQHVREYLQSYANHFGLTRYIRFNCKVVSVKYEGASDEEMESWDLWGGNGEGFPSSKVWTLKVLDLLTGSTEFVVANFVVLAVGRYSDVPNEPEFPSGNGPEVFSGKVMHSMEYAELDNQTARELIKGKRVVVVGFMKSAQDLAMECSIANGKENPCTMIVRNPHWTIAHQHLRGVPLAILFLNRFYGLMVHKPGEGLFSSVLATILSPLKWVLSRIAESTVIYRHTIKKYGMIPDYSFHEAVRSCLVAVTPQGFHKSVEEGEIILKKAQSFIFCKEGIILDDDQEKPIIPADLVIFATGFKGHQKLKEIFESPKFQDDIMGFPDSSLPLYRKCIHPRIPHLAVIGFTESVSNLSTSELQCRWFLELLDGTFKLPSIKEMEDDVSEWDKFYKVHPTKNNIGACLGGLHIWYFDQLCRDMGWNPRRKKGFLADLFLPYTPLDYAEK